MIDEMVNIICDPLELWKYAIKYAIRGVIASKSKLEGYAADNIRIRGLF